MDRLVTASPPDAPAPASRVVITHRTADGTELRLPLDRVAAALARRPFQSCGLGSRVWRFAPAALAEKREERGDDSFCAFKWTQLDDEIRRVQLPMEYGYLKRLESRRFPRVHAHGLLHEGAYVLVTEWIEGRNLALDGPAVIAALVRQRLFDRFCGDLLRIGLELREAGIAHSDIWESNILVRDLRPVLVDFGWAHDSGTPPPRHNLHQPDDEKAIFQLMMRMGAIRRMVAASVQRADDER